MGERYLVRSYGVTRHSENMPARAPFPEAAGQVKIACTRSNGWMIVKASMITMMMSMIAVTISRAKSDSRTLVGTQTFIVMIKYRWSKMTILNKRMDLAKKTQ